MLTSKYRKKRAQHQVSVDFEKPLLWKRGHQKGLDTKVTLAQVISTKARFSKYLVILTFFFRSARPK
jgi:hypothetical protein